MSGPSDGPPVAVIDIGSGAVKLLVTDRAGLVDGVATTQLSVKTKLFTDGAAMLPAAGMDATAAAFDRFAEVLAATEPASVAVVATAVARTVPDIDSLHALTEEKLGVPLQVLSGSREAELAFAGATLGRDIDGPVVVVDIGAGSTEFAYRSGADPIGAMSLPVGGRTLTDAYLLADPPRADELSSALSVTELHLDDLRRELPDLVRAVSSGTVIGAGATDQIAAVEIGVIDPDQSVDGYRLEKAGVEEVFRVLATEPAVDRACNPGLAPEHVDDIVGALCVLVEFMRRFGVEEVVVSERGLRHGLAAELMAKR